MSNRHSRRYQKSVRFLAQQMINLNGAAAVPGGDFNQTWTEYAEKRLGLRHYREQDWNEFWHGVILHTVLIEIEIFNRSRKSSSHERLRDKIRQFMVKPQPKQIIQRSTLFAKHAKSEEQLIQFWELVGQVLNEAANQSEQSEEDYPKWYAEMVSLQDAIRAARYKLTNQNEVKNDGEKD
jgi:hypothetical protein